MLPDYFEALNGDFRYQLTVIGKFAQATVASEIENNRFTIKTDQPDVKVSWQVTGIRQDASAKAQPLSRWKKRSLRLSAVCSCTRNITASRGAGASLSHALPWKLAAPPSTSAPSVPRRIARHASIEQ